MCIRDSPLMILSQRTTENHKRSRDRHHNNNPGGMTNAQAMPEPENGHPRKSRPETKMLTHLLRTLATENRDPDVNKAWDTDEDGAVPSA